MEVRLSESEVRDILAAWVSEHQGVGVTAKDVAFTITPAYDAGGDIREQSRPAAFAGATVNVSAIQRRKRDADDVLRG